MLRRFRYVLLMLLGAYMMPTLAHAQWHLDEMPWDATTLHEEPLYFIQQDAASSPSATLLFAPTEVLACTGFDRAVKYEEGRDYVLDREQGRVRLPAGSRIPFFTRAQMYPAPGSPNAIDRHIDGQHFIRWSEADFYVRDQALLSYRHAAGGNAALAALRPQAPAGALDRTRAKLKAGQPLKIVLFGDSISEGANASKSIDRPPYMPAYGQLVADELARRHGCKVDYHNLSKGGMTADWGAEQAPRVAAEKADLLIVAFGMNDGSWKVEAPRYLRNIKTIADAARQANPAAEVILVATMVGNPEWTGAAPAELYDAYRDGLRAMTGPGTAMIDMTTLWRTLLQRKRFYDLTGNGVNHPNDFGHRLYAQMLLALIEG